MHYFILIFAVFELLVAIMVFQI